MLIIELINEATSKGLRKAKACDVLNVSLRSFQRWVKECCVDKRKGAIKTFPESYLK